MPENILLPDKDNIQPGAEGFRFRGNRPEAVLLLHGFTGSPAEMRPLGEFLNARGYQVYCPRLPGHGTTLDECENSTAAAWYQRAEQACQELLQEFDKVYVAGLSMGGLLAIKIAALYPVQKTIFLAAPVRLRDKRIPLYPLLKWFIRYLPKYKKGLGEMSKYNITYKKLPTKPLGSLFALMKECRKELIPSIKIPVLILQSKTEKTVDPAGAQELYDRVATAPAKKKIVWYEDSGHILTLDKEYKKVFQEISEFLEQEDE